MDNTLFLLLAVIATIVAAIFLENSFGSTCRTQSGGSGFQQRCTDGHNKGWYILSHQFQKFNTIGSK